MYDAVIIGGGPAGSVAGSLLSKAGWSVAVIEKNIFPRLKVCGEFISATTLSLLNNLDLYKTFELLAGPEIKQIELYSGEMILSSSMPRHSLGNKIWGHAIGREHLDTFLLEEAYHSGAVVLQPWKACNLIKNTDHYICTIKQKNETKNILAKIVIMAHGSWEKQAWQTNIPTPRPSDLFGFKTHFTHAKLATDSMPLLVFKGGYGGIVYTSNAQISFSCCIRRSQLKIIRKQYPHRQAGDALLAYLFQINRGVRECLALANCEQRWLSVGPIQPGIRAAYNNGIFYIGNIAGEAHPIIAEGISIAIQSGWMLSNILISYQQRAEKNWVSDAGKQYKKHWEKTFSQRIRAATIFAKLATSQNAINFLSPFMKRYPKILSWGAKLSGKINAII